MRERQPDCRAWTPPAGHVPELHDPRKNNRYSRNLIDIAKPRERGLACASNERLAKRTVRAGIMTALTDNNRGYNSDCTFRANLDPGFVGMRSATLVGRVRSLEIEGQEETRKVTTRCKRETSDPRAERVPLIVSISHGTQGVASIGNRHRRHIWSLLPVLKIHVIYATCFSSLAHLPRSPLALARAQRSSQPDYPSFLSFACPQRAPRHGMQLRLEAKARVGQRAIARKHSERRHQMPIGSRAPLPQPRLGYSDTFPV